MSSQYYSSLEKFITFLYKERDGQSRQEINENTRKRNVVLKYCKTNYRRIGRGEDPNGEPEGVKLLLLIKPIHITRWFNDLAYKKIEPGPTDRPIYARGNTLLAHKRNLSYFMPRKDEKWDFHGAA